MTTTAVTSPTCGTSKRAAGTNCHSPRNFTIPRFRTHTAGDGQLGLPPAADTSDHSSIPFQDRTEDWKRETGYRTPHDFLTSLTRTRIRKSGPMAVPQIEGVPELILTAFQVRKRGKETETRYRSPPAFLTPLFRTEDQASGPRRPSQAADASHHSTMLFQAYV